MKAEIKFYTRENNYRLVLFVYKKKKKKKTALMEAELTFQNIEDYQKKKISDRC